MLHFWCTLMLWYASSMVISCIGFISVHINRGWYMTFSLAMKYNLTLLFKFSTEWSFWCYTKPVQKSQPCKCVPVSRCPPRPTGFSRYCPGCKQKPKVHNLYYGQITVMNKVINECLTHDNTPDLAQDTPHSFYHLLPRAWKQGKLGNGVKEDYVLKLISRV